MDLGNDNLRPQDYSEPVTATLCYSPNKADTVEATTRTSKAGFEFTQYTLFVDINGEKRAINYLMRSDLKTLRDKLGTKTEAWAGKTITLLGEQDGEYFRWKLDTAEAS